MGFFQRLRHFFSGHLQFSKRDRQTFHADLEPRLRVRAGTYGCTTCGQEFKSFAALRGHICRRVKG